MSILMLTEAFVYKLGNFSRVRGYIFKQDFGFWFTTFYQKRLLQSINFSSSGLIWKCQIGKVFLIYLQIGWELTDAKFKDLIVRDHVIIVEYWQRKKTKDKKDIWVSFKPHLMLKKKLASWMSHAFHQNNNLSLSWVSFFCFHKCFHSSLYRACVC